MKKLLLIFTLFIMALTASAQAYEYNCNFKTSAYYCLTQQQYTIENEYGEYSGRLNIGLSGNKDVTCGIGLYIIEKRFLKKVGSRKENESYHIQLKLSNGDVLKNVKNISELWIFFGSQDISINNFNDHTKDHIADVMSLLRTYDIASITIDDVTINTPGLRSADTFDAMCKTLVSKTGDQGLYGKRLTNNNNNNASNAQKPQTPTTSKPSTNSTQQNSQKPNSSNSSSKPSTSNSQSSTNNVDLSRASAKTLKAEAEKYNPDAMYLLGCRYHDGQLAGIEKNDRLSYQWLMTYYHVSNEKDGEKALDYIKNNLKRNNSTLKPSFEYLTKETNLTPMDFILHPLAYFPTSAIFMKEANMEREIATKKQMTIHTTSIKKLKKYDKGEIEIWGNNTLGKMPKLFNKEVCDMDWRSKNKKHANYGFSFRFGNRNEAETFLYAIAYETMQEGVFWEKSGYKTPRKIDDGIAIGHETYLTINGKRYYVPITLYLFDHKNLKPEERYCISRGCKVNCVRLQ